MSFRRRLRALIDLLVASALERRPRPAEDPREVLGRAYARQLELQATVRRAHADVLTARKRIELQSRRAGLTADRLEQRARTALEDGRQDVARDLLAQRSLLRAGAEDLDAQAAELATEEAGLAQASRRLELQVQELRLRREAAGAAYTAATARLQAGEALGALPAHDAELVAAVRRAEDGIVRLRDRARALDAAVARAALPPPGGDRIQQAGDARAVDDEARAELLRIEEELLWGRPLTARPALGPPEASEGGPPAGPEGERPAGEGPSAGV